MPDLRSGLSPEPLAEPEPAAALEPLPEPEPVAAPGHAPMPERGPGPGPGPAVAVVPPGARSLESRAAAPVAGLSGPIDLTERAVIGDGLRAPGVWCELTPCISHHIDPAALGVADVRARAIAAGWRYDALGRLTCPACQQTNPGFRGTRAVMRWERDGAITMASLMVAGCHEDQNEAARFSEETAIIPVLPDAVIPPGSSQAAGPPVRDDWSAG